MHSIAVAVWRKISLTLAVKAAHKADRSWTDGANNGWVHLIANLFRQEVDVVV